MCKFCYVEHINDYNNEKSNGTQVIDSLQDGHHIISVSIDRYQDGNCYRTNRLILDYDVTDHDGSMYSIGQKLIDIKYCPFCGEEL